MNEQGHPQIQAFRAELDQLSRQLSAAREALHALEARLRALEDQSQSVSPQPGAPASPPTPPPVPVQPPPLAVQPPPLPVQPPPLPVQPPPLPPTPQPQPVPPPLPPTVPQPPPLPPPAAPSEGPRSESWELRLGTYWLPRLGIVIVLTGVVFLAYYYHRDIPAWARALGLYLLCGAGILVGLRAEKNYQTIGRVLFAGGLAGVYFVTFALHYADALRLVRSPLVAGMLLLAVVAFMVGLAQARGRPWLAGMAILLGFYTAAISPIGTFTLVSNGLLAAGALYLVVTSGWTPLTALGLAGTYGTYLVWLVRDGEDSSLPLKAGFVFLYWGLFTLAVFASREDRMTAMVRDLYATLNNLLAFGFLTHALWEHERAGQHWVLALCFGVVLVGLSRVAGRRFRASRSTAVVYLVTGVAMLTLAVVEKFSGYRTLSALAVEAALLLVLGHVARQTALRWMGLAVQALCLFWAVGLYRPGFAPRPSHEITLAFAVALAYLGAFVQHWFVREDKGPLRDRSSERALAEGWAAVATLLLAVATADVVPKPWNVLVVAAEGLALLGLGQWLGRPLFRWSGAVFLLWFLMLVVVAMDRRGTHEPGRPALTWLAVAVAYLAALLQHCQTKPGQGRLRQRAGDRFLATALALLAGLALLVAVWDFVAAEQRATAAAVASGIVAALAALVRAGRLVLSSQLLLLGAYGSLLGGMLTRWTTPSPLSLPVSLVLVSLGFAWFLERSQRDKPPGSSLRQWVPLYLVGAVGTVVLSLAQRLDAVWQLWTMMLTALLSLAVGQWWRNPSWRWISSVAAVGGLVIWAAHELGRDIGWTGTGVVPAHFLAVALLVTFERLLSRGWRPPEESADNTRAVAAFLVAASTYLLLHVIRRAGEGEYLTALWTVAGFGWIGLGLLLRERTYRWAGLVVEALCVMRLGLYDLWQIREPLYRILSFIALGGILLLLGFLYAKFREKISKWL